ncbi:MAG TPA: alpha/beta fold hydrolase [Bacteroidia bacterium]|jgi:pimeloyl-ACP methyl ester carboxylesterase|nr:alpha/beta fold hydrolase [Bacteroidia bacterium]
MKNIVFVHGMFQNPKSWIEWIKYFEAKGYNCIAPAYPNHDGEPTELRKNIPSALSSLTLDVVVDSITREISKLDEKPVVIGHSMGGLITQILTNRDLVKAGICVDSAPPAGVISFKWSFLKSNLPVVNPFKGKAPCVMSKEHFHYAFCNVMTKEESDKAYDEFVTPESRNIPRSVMKYGKIDFKKPHPPLLMIAGSDDNIIPQSLVETNFRKYSDKSSKTELKVFPGRSHFICGQKGWEEVAEDIATWIGSLA